MTDYERGVEQASFIYKEVFREYVADNIKLRKFASELFRHWSSGPSRGCLLCEHEASCCGDCYYEEEAKRLGIEA